MSTTTWKFVVASVLASSGFVAFACGGGSEEGGGATTPSATQTATGPATDTVAVGNGTPTATVTTPPAPTLPASFTAADDARKTADAALTAIISSKETKCDVLATSLTKFTKDNSAAYATWNGEFVKLSDDQKKLVTSKAVAAPDLTASLSGGFKACVDKKDKKLGAAMLGFLAAATAGLPDAAGTAGTSPSSSAAKKK